MEKLSLYNLLSVFLPGAILTSIMVLILKGMDWWFLPQDDPEYLFITIFVSGCIFFGSLIDFLTRVSMKILHRTFGLYTPIEKIYRNSTRLDRIRPFFKKQMKKLDMERNRGSKVETLWREMYFELEANGLIAVPKDFQSFYFFFRNFFTLGTILLLLLIPFVIYFKFTTPYTIFLLVDIITMFLSVLAGRRYRREMIERLFWTYYSLHKK